MWMYLQSSRRMEGLCQASLSGKMAGNMRLHVLRMPGRAASLKAGGVGMRYTCMVEGKAVHLYYEDDNHWFMEKK